MKSVHLLVAVVLLTTLVSALRLRPAWYAEHPGKMVGCAVGRGSYYLPYSALTCESPVNMVYDEPEPTFYELNCPVSTLHQYVKGMCTAANEGGYGFSYSFNGPESWFDFCNNFFLPERPFPAFESLICKDSFGQTCGGKPGVKIAESYFNGWERLGSYYYLGQTVSGANRFCTIWQYRVPCITPACPAPPQDCVLAPDYGPWSDCFAFNGQCIQRRIRAIVSEAQSGGAPCPSDSERTQEIACVDAEQCARIDCEPYIYSSTGNCSVACGEGVKNVSVLSISSVPLDRCATNVTQLVSSSEVPCGNTLPCFATDPGTPISFTCSIQGNQGYKGSAPMYINVSFTGTANLTFTYTGAEIAAVFNVTQWLTGRRFKIDTTGTVVTGSTLLIKLLISDDNAQGLTGDQFRLTYARVQGVAGQFRANNFVMPVFSCLTEDRSPPVIMYAAYDTLSSTRRIAYAFSEAVYLCGSDGESVSIPNSGFTFVGTTGIVTTGTLTSDVLPYSRALRRSIANGATFETGAYVIANASAFCDAAGNANLQVPGYEIVLMKQEENGLVAYPVEAEVSTQVYYNSSGGSGINRAIISFPYGVFLSNLIDAIADLSIRATFTLNDSSTITLNQSISSLRPEYSSPREMEVSPSLMSRMVAEFPDIYDSAAFRILNRSDASLLSLVIPPTFSIDFGAFNLASIMAIPGRWTSVGAFRYNLSVGAMQGPKLKSAVIDVGSSRVTIQLTSPQPNNLSCSDFYISNRSCILVESNQLVGTFIMNETVQTINETEVLVGTNFTQADLLIPVIYIESNDTGASTEPSVILPSNLNGGPPTIINLTATGDGTLGYMTFTFSENIIEIVTPIEEAVIITNSNPFVTNVTYLGHTISENKLTVAVENTCVGPCGSTSTSTVKVNVTDAIVGSSNLVTQPVASVPVIDSILPKISSALEIAQGVVILAFSEPVRPYSRLGLHPPPTSTYSGGNNTYVCVFPVVVEDGGVFQVSAGAVSDVFGNKPTITQGRVFKYADFDDSCSPWKQWYFILLLVVDGVLVVLSIPGVYLTVKNWPK